MDCCIIAVYASGEVSASFFFFEWTKLPSSKIMSNRIDDLDADDSASVLSPQKNLSFVFFCARRFQIPASCTDQQAYTHALSDARCVFDMGVSI